MIEQKGMSIDQLIEQAGMGKDERNPLQTKANENIDVTQNSNWYDAYGVVNAIKDMTAERGTLMSRLTEGYEGSDLPVSYPIPYDVTNYFMLGKTAWTDEARPVFNNQQVTDAKSTLTQADFILQMGVTDKMLKHSTDRGLFDKIVNMMSKAALSTMEGCIINGDAETGATGNVNSDDQAPATTFGSASYHSLMIDHGIRESAVTNSKTSNVGAFDSDDLQTIRAILADRYCTRASELLFLFEPDTYLKAQTDDALKLAYSTARPSVDGAALQPFGIEAIAHDLVPQTEADGKVSATPSNNTLGQIACVYKPAVRHGFGQDVKVEIERAQGYGFELTISMEWSFVILDAANTCSLGINVTI